MPLGIARINSLSRFVPAGVASTFMVKNSLTGIDAVADNIFRHYAAHFLGDDSNGNPCFVWAYKDASDNEVKVTAFRVDSSDGSLTIGTPTSTGLVGQDPYIKTENTDAKTRSTSGWTAAGMLSFYYNTSVNLRLNAFTVDLSTLAVTIGSNIAPNVTTTAGASILAYVDNNRYILTHRVSNDDRHHELYSRSGTSLTNVANYRNTDITDGGFAIDATGFAYESGTPMYRAAITHDVNNLDGTNYNSFKFDNTTGRTSNTIDVFSGTELNSDNWIVPLDTASKAALIQTDSSLSRIITRAVDITWAASGTNPSHTLGTELTLTGTDLSPVGFGPGTSDDEFFYFYDNSGTLYYRPITASGTTLTEGTAIDTGLSVSTNTGTTKWEVAKSSSGDYLVGIVDSTGGNDPDVFVLKVV